MVEVDVAKNATSWGFVTLFIIWADLLLWGRRTKRKQQALRDVLLQSRAQAQQADWCFLPADDNSDATKANENRSEIILPEVWVFVFTGNVMGNTAGPAPLKRPSADPP